MFALEDLPRWFLYVFGIPFGLAWGSFLNVVIYRLPRDLNLAVPGSRCPGCGKPIAAYDNVPVLSWLLLRGRARCCGAPISPRYPAVELIGGLLAWAVIELVVWQLPPGTSFGVAVLHFVLALALGLSLVAMTLIDLEFMILPDSLTLGGAALGLVSAGFRGVGYSNALLGAAVGFALIWLPFVFLHQKLRGYPGMGLGDAKLVALAGAWFGWQGTVFALLAGAAQGTVIILVLMLIGSRMEEPEAVKRERAEYEAALAAATPEERVELEREAALDPLFAAPKSGFGKVRISFGPFLALAILEYLLLGPAIREWISAWMTGA